MNNPNVVDMAGSTYGRLTVLKRVENDVSGNARWLCKCECGNEKIVLGRSLRTGRTRSCGCLLAESSKQRMTAMCTKHGFSNKKLYRVYMAMRERCEKPSASEYSSYGGRGISMCKEWRERKEAFFEWAMQNGYKEGLQIDRIDTNGDYCPGNCRWATRSENMNNIRKNVRFEHNGVSHTLAEWARIARLPYMTVYGRYKAWESPAEILRR